MTTLHIRQSAPTNGQFPIRLTLKRPGQADTEAEAGIAFALSEREHEDIRWYLEDYLQNADTVEPITVDQIEARMAGLGVELYDKVFAANRDTQALWFSVRNDLADLRVEVVTSVAEAASIPWELTRDPQLDSPICLRVKAFVRVQSNPSISFVQAPRLDEGRIRLLYIACRPGGSRDVELRAVANRLLQDLGAERARFDIKALRPPTFEQLQQELAAAKAAKRPDHIVHFDGHGVYADLSASKLADWGRHLSRVSLGGPKTGKHGYLLFEHPSEDNMRPVDGQALGQLLHDTGVPMLVLNACQSAMHEATSAPKTAADTHDEVRAIGSLAQAVVDQGIPAVLGMRYSVYVATAAQYIGQLYAALASGRTFGEAISDGRKHLHLNPERWLGLKPRVLQDWFVPIGFEAAPIAFETADAGQGEQPELDPVQTNQQLLRYVPAEGFVGRDETILALDRAFDAHSVVLLHAYAGQGKSSTAVEFARWYAVTGGLGPMPLVFFASFEKYTDLDDRLNQIGQALAKYFQKPKVEWGAQNDPTERLAIVRRILRTFPLLWIWDNVEPIAGFPEGTASQWTPDEQAALRDFLHQISLDAACKAVILLTSRRPETGWLGGIPHRIPMARMTDVDAARLALKLGAERQLKPSEIEDWQPLLDYCHGNPLTLRVLVGQAIRAGVRGGGPITRFVDTIRSGESAIEDVDAEQGRDKSLGASLDYGFRNAFTNEELPIIALLHLFQGVVDVDVLQVMGRLELDERLPEIAGRNSEHIKPLLERAAGIGLLSHVASTWFAIHPALPWFLSQLFNRHFDGSDGRSSADLATRAWSTAVGEFSAYYHKRYTDGDRDIVNIVAHEEANLLRARGIARRAGMPRTALGIMQGLSVLYRYQGRLDEWARLVEEVRLDYLTPDDEPRAGREDDYAIVMAYRVLLARDYERDVEKSLALQRKPVAFERRRAEPVMERPDDAILTDEERHILRNYAVSIEHLGNALRALVKPECVASYREAVRLYRRIGDTTGESGASFNLSAAYTEIPEIQDLDAAETVCQSGLALNPSDDVLNRSRFLRQLGIVHDARLQKAIEAGAPNDVLSRHFVAADEKLQEALRVCPSSATTVLALIYNSLGVLYSEVGRMDEAREYFENDARCEEHVGNRYGAGQTRFNIAFMYLNATRMEKQPQQIRDYLTRSRAYAGAALRDFEHYGGRAADQEDKCRSFIASVERQLAALPPQSSAAGRGRP